MANAANILADLNMQAKGYWAQRILAECTYAIQVSLAKKGKYDVLIAETLTFLQNAFRRNGALIQADCKKAEKLLLPMQADAKQYSISLISHAHIDMNWMWGYSETVAITLETFRTILKFLKEYPQFTYAQSQASVYRIVEQHEPEMLKEIKKYIKQGRWEVTASQWVEADKNCSNGEAQARHLLYTRQYLSRLLDLDPASLNLDFEPDTFGHNANIPEILTNAGVKYYYHCRAQETNMLVYRWRAPSGAEILVNREAFWYNGTVEADYAYSVCDLCEKLGISETLRVYGVGDHGGGPTRRDIERILDFSSWPVFPRWRFGTYREYFAQLEEKRESFPLFTKEINSIFTGCYTTQTRIKLANQLGQARLTDTDTYASMAEALAPDYRSAKLFDAWENILFNQFHDILPGSGIVDTREYAMGMFQKSLALSNTRSAAAMRAIAHNIDTSALPTEDIQDSEGIAEGAGVGFSVESFGLPKTERGRGKNRILHFFNPSALPFHGTATFTIWDWPGDFSRFCLQDSRGNTVTHQRLAQPRGKKQQEYWGHAYAEFAAEVRVPAFGYATYIVTEREAEAGILTTKPWENNEKPYYYSLENEHIKAVFDVSSLKLVSLLDKQSEAELISPEGAGFVQVLEDNAGMTAWRIGRYTQVQDLQQQVRVTDVSPGLLRQSLEFAFAFGNGSRLRCTVSLDACAKQLDFDVHCDWLEVGNAQFIPQLAFHIPLGYNAPLGKYSVPVGILGREAMDLDVGTNGLAAATGEEEQALYLVAQGKYGYRLTENRLSLTLLHSSTAPDRYPELGEHRIRFALGVSGKENVQLANVQQRYDHPVQYLSGTVHPGKLPLDGAGYTLTGGSTVLSALKPAEDGRGQILRVYETDGKACTLTITRAGGIIGAARTNILEETADEITIRDGKASIDVQPYRLVNLRIW